MLAITLFVRKHHLLILSFLLYFPLLLSQPIHILFWEQQGKLHLYSLCCLATAVAKILSPLYSQYISRKGIHRGLLLGYSCCTLGLLLRAFPNHILIALLSGAMTGLGIPLGELAQQGLFLMMSEERRQWLLFWTNQLLTIARSAGALLSGWGISLLYPLLKNPYQAMLLLSALLASLALWVIPSTDILKAPAAKRSLSTPSQTRELFRMQGWLTIQFTFSMFLISFSLTVLLPIFPLYLKQLSLSPATIGTVTALGLLGGAGIQFLYTHHFKGQQIIIRSFAITAMLTAIILSWFFYGFQHGKIINCVACLITFHALRALSSLLITVIQLTLVEKTLTLSLLGLSQTALVCGELVGNMGLPYIYHQELFVRYPLLPAAISFCGAGLLYYCRPKIQ